MRQLGMRPPSSQKESLRLLQRIQFVLLAVGRWNAVLPPARPTQSTTSCSGSANDDIVGGAALATKVFPDSGAVKPMAGLLQQA
jgi:hypothetical protein